MNGMSDEGLFKPGDYDLSSARHKAEEDISRYKTLERFQTAKIDKVQSNQIDDIRRQVTRLAEDLCNLTNGRGKAMALTKLEECQYWATKAVCGND